MKLFRESVKNYLETVDTSSLIFTNYWDDEIVTTINFSDRNNHRALVRECLSYMDMYDSTNAKTKKYETSHSAERRSVVDIYRHLRYYYPRISIFQLMRAIWELDYALELDGMLCTGIGRRVFRYSYNEIGDKGYDIIHKEEEDEFGLYFDEWKDI